MTDTTKLADELVNLCDSIGAALNGDALSDGRFNLSVWVARNYDDILAALRAIPAADAPKGKPLSETCCPHCVYDEAEGGLFRHCEACMFKIVSELWTREHAAINGPAACTLPSSHIEEAGRAGIVGSGAAPIEGLADAIAWAHSEAAGNDPMPPAHMRSFVAAAGAYQEAAAELAYLRQGQIEFDAACRAVARHSPPQTKGAERLCAAIDGITAELARVKGERDKFVAALRLVDGLHRKREVHLGWPRWSGFENGCIPCVIALVLSEGMDRSPTAEELKAALAASTPAKERE